MDQSDEVDIYGGLPDYDFDKKFQELEFSNKNLRKRVKELECTVQSLSKENVKLAKREKSLDRNISVLYATALAEIEEKKKMITDLRQEKDAIVFRRKSKVEETNRMNSDTPSEIQDFISSNVQPGRRREPQEESIKENPLEAKNANIREVELRKEISRKENRSVEDGRIGRSREVHRRDSSRENSRRESHRNERKREISREDSRREAPREDLGRDGLRRVTRNASRSDRGGESKKMPEIVKESSRGTTGGASKTESKKDDAAVKENSKPVSMRVASTAQPRTELVEKIIDTNVATNLVADVKPVDHQDTSMESNSSSSKENAQESKLLRAERIHQKKVANEGAPQIALRKEIKKISPLKKKSPKKSVAKTANESDEIHVDLLSSLLASEKERINGKSVKKKKKKVTMAVNMSPATPGKFLIEGNLSQVQDTAVQAKNMSEDSNSLSPEFNGVPETPGKSLLASMSINLESSPVKIMTSQQCQEIESAVFSILPTPLKLLAQHPFISPLHNTPTCVPKPANNRTPETVDESPKLTSHTPALAKTSRESDQFSFKSPQLSIDSSQAGSSLIEPTPNPKTVPAQQTPVSSTSAFPFKRKRVLKIKVTSSSNNSSLSESVQNDSSLEEPSAKKVCPANNVLQQVSRQTSLFSPIKDPGDAIIIPKKRVRSPSKKAAVPKSLPKPVQKLSPVKKSITPIKMIQPQVPASVSSTGRKSNDSGTSQDFHLHYTSDSEVSRSPSPFVPRPASKGLKTSTPHVDKKRVKLVSDPHLVGLTPNSKKKQKRKNMMSEMFGASPASEREYHLDMDVTEEMRIDLQETRPGSKRVENQARRKSPEKDLNSSQRSRKENDEKYGRSPDRNKYKRYSRSPEFSRRRPSAERIRSPEERSRRRYSVEKERKRSPEDKMRRRSPNERRWSPEERVRRKSPVERERRRSPVERRRSPVERRRSPVERRRSPVERDRKRSPDDRDRRRYLEDKRRSPEDRRRSPDDRERKYSRRSRSVERHAYASSSRKSPNYYRRKSPGSSNVSSRRSPSPRDRRYRDHSVSPPREEDRRKYKRYSRSVSPPPKLNGSARYRDPSPKKRSPERSHPESYEVNRSERSRKNVSYERREERSVEDRKGSLDSRDGSGSEDCRGRREAPPTKDLRRLLDKSRSKLPLKKSSCSRVEPPSENIVDKNGDQVGSEEGEVDSD